MLIWTGSKWAGACSEAEDAQREETGDKIIRHVKQTLEFMLLIALGPCPRTSLEVTTGYLESGARTTLPGGQHQNLDPSLSRAIYLHLGRRWGTSTEDTCGMLQGTTQVRMHLKINTLPGRKALKWENLGEYSWQSNQLSAPCVSPCRRGLKMNETQAGFWAVLRGWDCSRPVCSSAEEVVLLSGCLSPACKLQPKLLLRNTLNGGEMMWFLKECIDFGEVTFIFFDF